MENTEISLEQKEKYVEMVKECRSMIKSGKYTQCPCPKKKCEWHGKCFECVYLITFLPPGDWIQIHPL